MVNTRQKGRRNELRAAKILEAAGYDVQLAPLPQKWSLQNDLFGLWDVMAVNSREIRFVQVKTNQTARPEDREAMELWPCPPNCSKEIWIFHDGAKEPVIKELKKAVGNSVDV